VGVTFGHDRSASHSATRSRPAAVSSYTFLSGWLDWPTCSTATSPTFSSRPRVTYTWPGLSACPGGPSAWTSRWRTSYPWAGSLASNARIGSRIADIYNG